MSGLDAIQLGWTLGALVMVVLGTRELAEARSVENRRRQRGDNGLRLITSHAAVRLARVVTQIAFLALAVGAVSYATEPSAPRSAFNAAAFVLILAHLLYLVVQLGRDRERIANYEPDRGKPFGRRKEDRPV